MPSSLPLRSDAYSSPQSALGRAIMRARRKSGVTQIELARQLGMHRTQLGHVEQGRKDFQLSTLVRIADALGIPLSMLVRSAEL